MPKYYPINEEAAKRAKDMNSFSDYQPGSATAGYRAMVDEAYAAAERQKARVDPMYHDKIDALVDCYARKLAENLNERNVIDARVPSILISGGGNFPVAKKHKQNAARDRNYGEYAEISKLLDKIRSVGMGGISADDDLAVEKLTKKLEGLESLQATMKAVMLENGRGFALGEHPTAPSRYVTWACYDDKDGQRQYEWGHYGNDRTAMEQDFTDRVQDYQRIYNVGIRQTEAPGLYKYYSTQRPVDIGTFPKPPYNKPDEIFNYDQRIPVENGSFLAWGYLTYTRPLTEKQASDYELRPAPDNPDRPRPIAEQMKNAAKLAEADRGSEAPAPQRRQPDRGDR